MPTTPWSPVRSDYAGAHALALGTRLELRHYRHIPGFLRATMTVLKQIRHSDGALGVSLIAQPARKTFWTLSVWADQGSLDAFVRTSPHREVMARFTNRLTDPRFESWTVAPAELPKPRGNAKDLWRVAQERLGAATG